MNEVVNDMNVETQQKLNKLREIGISNVEELTTALQKENIHFSPYELPALGGFITTTFGIKSGLSPFPEWLGTVFSTIVQGRTANSICDPYARIGLLIGIIQETTKAKSTIAFTPLNFEAIIGKVLVDNAEWRVGNSTDLLSSLDKELDIAACILPWGGKTQKKLKINTLDGYEVELDDDFGQQILILASMNLSTDGIGLFVVAPSFFFSPHSVFLQFSTLGLGLEAALELPAGTFAPVTNIRSYLVIVRKHTVSKMFVGQLSNDSNINLQILSNLKNGKEGDLLELGRFVDAQSFKGLDAIRIQEKLKRAESQFGKPALSLEILATKINLGRSGESFQFPREENAIFIPLIGISDVVDSFDKLKLKPQNYAQVIIDPKCSKARFVAQFLNSELGKEIRETHKSGFIPKLSKQTLEKLEIFLPDLYTQKAMLDLETRIIAEQNTLLELQGELGQLQRDLWTKPHYSDDVDCRLSAISNLFSVNIKKHTAVSFDQWIKTLPFPLSSILHDWQRTDSMEYEKKYQYLIDFFEATVEFLSMVLLSAFSSNQSLFEFHWQEFKRSVLKKSSIKKATFGTWRMVVKYFGEQTREMLKDEMDRREQCATMFTDSSLRLPTVISSEEIYDIISTTNEMRNNWKGHTGRVDEKEAEIRHEQLFGEVQKLRNIIADIWSEIELIQSSYCVLKCGVFENTVTVLMGNNSAFLNEKRSLATCLDTNCLYLLKKGEFLALELIPLVQFGPCDETPKNTCYFYSKIENNKFKFVSYYSTGRSECYMPINKEKSKALKDFLEKCK